MKFNKEVSDRKSIYTGSCSTSTPNKLKFWGALTVFLCKVCVCTRTASSLRLVKVARSMLMLEADRLLM